MQRGRHGDEPETLQRHTLLSHRVDQVREWRKGGWSKASSDSLLPKQSLSSVCEIIQTAFRN